MGKDRAQPRLAVGDPSQAAAYPCEARIGAVKALVARSAT